MSDMIDYSIVPATHASQEFFWQALYYAAHMDEESGIQLASAKTDPALMPYVAGWGDHAGDIGFVAVMSNRSNLGAAWVRLMPNDWPLYRHVNSNIPELAIAVLPDYLGRGIGDRLLRTLIEAAGTLHRGIALSVRENNPARRLYERFGFRAVDRITNRVGGASFVMKLDLT